MNKTKSLYSAPSAELLVVRFEENIMSPKYSSKGTETMTFDAEEDF